MAYRLIVFIERQNTEHFKTTQSNQEALAALMAQAERQAPLGTTLMVEGISYGASLFPKWMADAITAGIPNLRYAELNFSYQVDFETVEQARLASTWVQQFKAWAMEHGPTPLDKDIAKGLDSRIMDTGHADLDSLEEF